jgi:hypothetical protein
MNHPALTVLDCTLLGNRALGDADAVVAEDPSSGAGLGSGTPNAYNVTLFLIDRTLLGNLARQHYVRKVQVRPNPRL